MPGTYPRNTSSPRRSRTPRGRLARALFLLAGALLCGGPAAGRELGSSRSVRELSPLAHQRLAAAGLDASSAPAREDLRLPAAVDNSALPSFPPLFDQGDLESCTAVVSTYYQLTHAIGLRRGWDQSRLDNQNRFSPAWTYNLTNQGVNLGVSLPRAYAALAEHGAVTLEAVPYRGVFAPDEAPPLRNPEAPALRDLARGNRIARFGLVEAREPTGFLAELKRLLLNGHLLSGSTAIEGWNRREIASAPGEPAARHVGEFICTEIDPAAAVTHAITIVGYDDEVWVDLDGDGEAGPGERGALKIVNSWGTRDWNAGFRWLHYAAVVGRPESDSGSASARRGAFWRDRVFWLEPGDLETGAAHPEARLASAAPGLDEPAGAQGGR